MRKLECRKFTGTGNPVGAHGIMIRGAPSHTTRRVTAAAIACLLAATWGEALAVSRGVTITTELGDQGPVSAKLVFDPNDTTHSLVRDLDDGVGNAAHAQASVVDAPVPQVSGGASVTAAGAGHSLARAVIDVELSYGITLEGPNPQVVAPIVFTGITHLSATGAGVDASTALTWDGGPLAPLAPVIAEPLPGAPGFGWRLPGCAARCVVSDGFSFSSVIGANGGLPVNVAVYGHLDVVAKQPNQQVSGVLMIDPYAFLETDWALAHPDYRLVIEVGIGNAQVVPLPPAWQTALAALVPLLGWRRRAGNGGLGKR